MPAWHAAAFIGIERMESAAKAAAGAAAVARRVMGRTAAIYKFLTAVDIKRLLTSQGASFIILIAIEIRVLRVLTL